MGTPNDAADRGLFAIPGGLALVLVILGVMLLAIRHHLDAKAAAMRSWPSIMGTVASCQYVDERNDNTASGWQHRLETGYRWTVDGRGFQRTYSTYAGRGQHFDAKPTRYHVGDPIRVYYDPANPSEGSLTNDVPQPSLLMLIIGVALLVLSLPFWYLAVRMFLKQP